MRLLHTIEHNNHLCLVFEPLSMNLKEVQNKFGKGGLGLCITGETVVMQAVQRAVAISVWEIACSSAYCVTLAPRRPCEIPHSILRCIVAPSQCVLAHSLLTQGLASPFGQ